MNVFLHGSRTGEAMVGMHALDPNLSSTEQTHGFSLSVLHSNVQPDLVVPWLLDTATQIHTGMDPGLPFSADVFWSQLLGPDHGEHFHGLKIITGFVAGQEDLL